MKQFNEQSLQAFMLKWLRAYRWNTGKTFLVLLQENLHAGNLLVFLFWLHISQAWYRLLSNFTIINIKVIWVMYYGYCCFMIKHMQCWKIIYGSYTIPPADYRPAVKIDN